MNYWIIPKPLMRSYNAWMIVLELADASEEANLMTKEQYEEFLEENE